MPSTDLINDYSRIEKAIRFLDRERASAPSLAEAAAHVGLSESHFQKLFTRWAGISPKRFLQHRTAEVVKRLLREGRPVLEASYEAGLSGPGRLHDLLVNAEAATPGEVQRAGEGVTVRYGFHPSPFGDCLVGVTARGVCHLAFVHPVSRSDALERLRKDWSKADLIADQDGTRDAIAQAFPPPGGAARPALALHVKGTNFQLKVWRALLEIPSGEVTTYGTLAARIGKPKASRAVGTAVGSNPVSYLIPCHRVIRSTGELGGYAWGPDRKRVMLALECGSEEVEGAKDSLTPSTSHLPPAAKLPARTPARPPAARPASAVGARHARTA